MHLHWYRKHIDPVVVSFPENEASDFILHDSYKRHFLGTLLRANFTIQSYTFSNASLRLQTNIGYLDCIDSSAAKMSTIY